MAVKNAVFKVDNGSTFDEVMFKTIASQVVFTDGKTFQQKLDDGSLKGATGNTGAAGAKGATGPTGPAGSNGSAGTAGAKGATGPTGPAGSNGTAGTAGAKGATGPTGPAGSNGTAGTAGAKGATGPTGPSGATASVVSTSANGLAPKVTNTGYFLRGDGTWQAANNYSHPTGNGNNHIPTNGAANQYLKYSAAGTAAWSALPAASTSAQGIVQLNNDVNSTSTTQAATANAVKLAYDKANEAFQNANNGKTTIANVIGSPITTSDTWANMQTKIQTMKNTLVTKLNTDTAGGYSSSSTLNNLVTGVNNVKNSMSARLYCVIGTSSHETLSLSKYITKRNSKDAFYCYGNVMCITTGTEYSGFCINYHNSMEIITSTEARPKMYIKGSSNSGDKFSCQFGIDYDSNTNSLKFREVSGGGFAYLCEMVVGFSDVNVGDRLDIGSTSSSTYVLKNGDDN